ncbi:MAG: anion transporter [Alphaproteobacteria bacterium]|nr:anion transporter [Alphaproteobacteria bacterium]
MSAALLIFAGTYAVIALGRAPGLRLDRTGAALLGASLMVAAGVLTPAQAWRAIDANTLVLLLGMMILVAHLRLAGFFGLVARWAGEHAHRPALLLIAVVAMAGLLSAFLVNDTVCVMLAPLVAEIVLATKRKVEPYLLALALASNAGSVATITGNPQNIVIGSISRIPYTEFAAALAPVAIVSLVIVAGAVLLAYRAEFRSAQRLDASPQPLPLHRWLLAKSLVATLGAVAAFFAGVPPAEAAIVAGSLLLLTRRLKPQRIFVEIDWPLLLMFAGLFVVVRGLEEAAFTPAVLAEMRGLHLGRPAALALVSAVLSNLVSNVPAVLLLKPFVPGLADPHRAWLVLAMASTLAGNLTIAGSVANLIVVERARRSGVHISFWRHLRIGAPVTVLTILVGVWMLA